MDTFLSATFSALAVVLVVFLAQRFLPASRWTRRLAQDAAILAQLPSGPERDEFEQYVRLQTKRLSTYRTKMSGANLAVTIATWAIIIGFVGGIAAIIATTTFVGGTFAAAIEGAEWPIFVGLISIVGYAIFHSLGSSVAGSLSKQKLDPKPAQ